MKFEEMGNDAIRRELGHRLQRARLDRNMTQGELGDKAGVARRTLVAAENGLGLNIDTLISVLRALGMLGQLDQFIPVPPMSPVQLAKLKGHERQRATGRRGKMRVREGAGKYGKKTTWTWKE